MLYRKPFATVFNLLVVLAALLIPALANVALASEVDDSALALVEERHLGEGLGWLGYQVASRTVTFGSIVNTLGKTRAQTLIKDELMRVQPDFQAQWNSNLAAAYAQHFTVDELQALNNGKAPPLLANKLKAKQSDVGIEIKDRSGELLQSFVSKALDNALAKAGR